MLGAGWRSLLARRRGHPPLDPLPGREGGKERDMALDDLEILVRVIDAGSLSAAGRALGFTPAMVSKRIARLEQRLGARLLQRTTRRLSPTDTGHAFYERAVAILAAVEDAETLFHGRDEKARGQWRG